MSDIEEVAKRCGMRKAPAGWHAMPSDLERFRDEVIMEERIRMAKLCARLPFGETASSFAVWIATGGIREFK